MKKEGESAVQGVDPKGINGESTTTSRKNVARPETQTEEKTEGESKEEEDMRKKRPAGGRRLLNESRDFPYFPGEMDWPLGRKEKGNERKGWTSIIQAGKR